MTGIAYSAPYKRKGKLYYKTYNRAYLAPYEYTLLERLPNCIVLKTVSGRAHTYRLTKTGLAWLGRQIGETIREIE